VVKVYLFDESCCGIQLINLTSFFISGQRSEHNLNRKIGKDSIAQSQDLACKSCKDSIVFMQLSIENRGVPPWGRGYNRCLVSMVSKSELVSSSVELEQLVSSCWHKELLIPEFLRICTDVLGILPRSQQLTSISENYCGDEKDNQSDIKLSLFEQQEQVVSAC
jgi:hypothetical protein